MNSHLLSLSASYAIFEPNDYLNQTICYAHAGDLSNSLTSSHWSELHLSRRPQLNRFDRPTNLVRFRPGNPPSLNRIKIVFCQVEKFLSLCQKWKQNISFTNIDHKWNVQKLIIYYYSAGPVQVWQPSRVCSTKDSNYLGDKNHEQCPICYYSTGDV